MTTEQETILILIFFMILIFVFIAIGIAWWNSYPTVPGGVVGTPLGQVPRRPSDAILWVVGFFVFVIILGLIVWAIGPKHTSNTSLVSPTLYPPSGVYSVAM